MKIYHKWANELGKQLKALGLPDGSWSLKSFNEATNEKVIEIQFPDDWLDSQKTQAQSLIDAWPSKEVIEAQKLDSQKIELRTKVIEAMVDSLIAGKVPNDPVMADVVQKLSADINNAKP